MLVLWVNEERPKNVNSEKSLNINLKPNNKESQIRYLAAQ